MFSEILVRKNKGNLEISFLSTYIPYDLHKIKWDYKFLYLSQY